MNTISFVPNNTPKTWDTATADEPQHMDLVDAVDISCGEDLYEELCDDFQEDLCLEKNSNTTTATTRTVTVVLPDGKRVHQVKKEDEELVPIPLTFAGKSKKGYDVYVRGDGKIVRLVKRKDKSRMERWRRERLMRLIQNEEEDDEDEDEDEEWSVSGGSDWEGSWDEEQIMSNEGSWRSTGSDEQSSTPRSNNRKVMVAGDAAEAAPVETEESEQDEEDTFEGSMTPTSDSADKQLYCNDKIKKLDSDVDSMLTGNTVAETVTVQTLESEERGAAAVEPQEKQEVRLSYVERMKRKSFEALGKAERMKSLVQFAQSLGDVKEEHFRFVNQPRHPTQKSSTYKRCSSK